MLQQMQRQMRNGGGIQEMMKAMMQGQGGDQFDMEEMQRKRIPSMYRQVPETRAGMMQQMGGGMGGLGGLGGLGGMPNMSEMFKMMGGMGRGR